MSKWKEFPVLSQINRTYIIVFILTLANLYASEPKKGSKSRSNIVIFAPETNNIIIAPSPAQPYKQTPIQHFSASALHSSSSKAVQEPDQTNSKKKDSPENRNSSSNTKNSNFPETHPDPKNSPHFSGVDPIVHPTAVSYSGRPLTPSQKLVDKIPTSNAGEKKPNQSKNNNKNQANTDQKIDVEGNQVTFNELITTEKQIDLPNIIKNAKAMMANPNAQIIGMASKLNTTPQELIKSYFESAFEQYMKQQDAQALKETVEAAARKKWHEEICPPQPQTAAQAPLLIQPLMGTLAAPTSPNIQTQSNSPKNKKQSFNCESCICIIS